MQRTSAPVRLDAEKLTKVCGLFRSDHAGERATAAAMADQMVRSAGLQWCDVIALPRQVEPPAAEPEWPREDDPPPPDRDLFWCWPLRWQAAVRFADRCRRELPDRERDFIDQLAVRNSGATPSERQCLWLRGIVTRLMQKGFIP